MMSFRGDYINVFALPSSSVWLLTDIAEAKGRLDFRSLHAPRLLRALRETAIVQSAESSNRIEGVTVEPSRRRPLVLGKARPRDRSEEELQGYQNVLKRIHESAAEMTVDAELLRCFHRAIQESSGDAGQWKRIDNEIVQLRPHAPPLVRFRPVSAKRTPTAVAELCRSYRHAIDRSHLVPLVGIAAFVFDFLCIHPFRDGNGRVSRLLTLLILYQQGHDVGRYVSLEKLIEDSREDNYEALHRSAQRWHEGKHEFIPWLNYFLTILRRAYRALEQSAERHTAHRGAKTALVEAELAALEREFTAAELLRACPSVSRDLVRRVLRQWQEQGRVICLGRGPGARWRKKG